MVELQYYRRLLPTSKLFRRGKWSGWVYVLELELPRHYRVQHADFFPADDPAMMQIGLSVRQMGPPHGLKRFLVAFDETELPRIIPGPHDPPDSEDLQWSFWQALRVGGAGLYSVYDVSHLTLDTSTASLFG